ncbi:MAG TPA: GTP cyclohydrolase II, partial [Polyangiaceae bacterium]|nr:GTP cyclohydrolase II [Polyangiaceae bacterium]
MDTLSRANEASPAVLLEQLAQAALPTRHGTFQLRVFRWDDPSAHPALSREHCALIMGEVRGRRNVPVRVHSECLTGEVFSSLKCDCREQFDHAQAAIAKHGFGVILYLRQEGRGIGLANKVRAYALQAMGADTVEANELLHLPVDARTYDVAAAMLRELGIESIELMTNNPAKVDELSKLGITVAKR